MVQNSAILSVYPLNIFIFVVERSRKRNLIEKHPSRRLVIPHPSPKRKILNILGLQYCNLYSHYIQFHTIVSEKRNFFDVPVHVITLCLSIYNGVCVCVFVNLCVCFFMSLTQNMAT